MGARKRRKAWLSELGRTHEEARIYDMVTVGGGNIDDEGGYIVENGLGMDGSEKKVQQKGAVCACRVG